MATDRISADRIRLLVAPGALFITVALAAILQNNSVQPRSITPTLTGQPEYCVSCHDDLPQISPSHPIESFGCVTCHGGEALALEAELAHSSLRGGANPSDLSVVERSCGGELCHSGTASDQRDHIQRVSTSIQSTYTGAISSVWYTFGAQSSLEPIFGSGDLIDTTTRTGITELDQVDPSQEPSPMLQKFGVNCLSCHINAQPPEGEEYQRFTGCASCHTPIPNGADLSTSSIHMLTTAIPYAQCNTCHNRGNYDLRQMSFIERTDQPLLRIDKYYQPIADFVQCEYTLDCVDCHTLSEVMGDGDIHADQASIQYIECRTCHGTVDELPKTRVLVDSEDIAFRLASLNHVMPLELGDEIIVTDNGEPLWNARKLPDGTFEMIGKSTRQYFTFRPVMGSQCQQNATEQESRYCHECHAVDRTHASH